MVTRDGVMWLIHRLSVMSPVEIAHRGFTAVCRAGERLATRLTGRRPGPVSRPVASFGFMVSDEPVLFVPPTDAASPVDELLAGHIPVFGHQATWSDDPDFWHTDPLSGAVWPRTPGLRIDYRPGNPIGDARTVWELNRLQHLVDLALIAGRSPEKRVAVGPLVLRQFESWCRANPYPHGVNHLSAMEHALRVIAVLHAFDLLRPAFDAPARQQLLDMALGHAWHIERHLSRYSSAGNHTIAEAVGLLYAGVLFPEHPGASRWADTGRRLLATEGDRQVRADGGPLEQATWYLLFITDLMGLAQLLLRHKQRESIPAMDAAAERARAFLGSLAQSPDDLPRIGDADDGYALSRHLRISWDRTSPCPAHREFPHTGLTAVSFDGHDRLLFLHKDLGMPPNYGHGHSDALSVVFRWKDHDVLLDAGTYLYGGPPEFRNYFRSAVAHNTLTIDQQDQATQTGPFLWRHPYRSRCVLNHFEDHTAAMLATHDGYRAQGAVHWRGVVYRKDRYLAVWDQVECDAGHTGTATLHWHLGCNLEPAERVDTHLIRLPGEEEIHMTTTPADIAVHAGSRNPLSGWRSTEYGSVTPCRTLSLRLPTTGNPEALTIFWLGHSSDPDETLTSWLERFRDRADSRSGRNP